MNSTLRILAQASVSEEGGLGPSLLTYISGGGVIGWIIVALSVVALTLVVIHAVQIRRTTLLPAVQVASIRDLLGAGRADAALEYCSLADNDSFLTRILAPGLTRYLRSPFGAFEIKQAIEEAGAEQSARLYRATDGLGIIGTVAPLLGLLGTVWGMILTFDVIQEEGLGGVANLAGGISQALITTMAGLSVGIPTLIAYKWVLSRADELVLELEEISLSVLDKLVEGEEAA